MSRKHPQGHKVVRRDAVKIANTRMRQEIYPLLSRTHPNVDMWTPLSVDFKGASAYGMKLRSMADALVIEILTKPPLLARTEEIVVESTMAAALRKPKPFVENILDDLFSGDPQYEVKR